MAIVDPRSWSVMIFGDEGAWLDFLGAHELQHRAFAFSIRAAGGLSYPLLPLGDGGGAEWHEAHQLVHQGETTSLGIAEPPDFRGYELSDPDQFSTYTYLHALEHVRVRQAIPL